MFNARSIATVGKMDELRLLCSSHKPHFLIVTESWLTSNHDSVLFHVDGYNLFRQDRLGATGGGVVVWTNSNLTIEQHHALHSPEVGEYLFLIFKFNHDVYLLCAAYIPPNRNVSTDAQIVDFINDEIDTILDKYPELKIVIGGDLNRLDTRSIMSAHDLVQKVLDPTRGNAILDQFLISSTLSSLYPPAEVGPPFYSGRRGSHGQVSMTPYQSFESKESLSHMVYDSRKPFLSDFVSHLGKSSFQDLYDEPDVDKKVTLFYATFNICFSYIPKRKVFMTRRDKPWMTPFLKDLITQRWNAFRSNNLVEYNRLKFKCKNQILLCKKAWYNNTKSKSKNMWSVVRDVAGNASRNTLSSLVSQFSTAEEAANSINARLSSVFSERDQIEPYPDDDWGPLTDVATIFRMLDSLPINKSTGSDGIPNKFYRIAAPFIAEPLCNIINTSVLQRKVPLAFKECCVSPIPKSNPPTLDSLRPITLLSVPAKLLEKHVLLSEKKRIVSNFPSMQFAYRPNSNTTCALISIHDQITTRLDDPRTDACILINYDFHKAFDSISHSILLRKLELGNFPYGFIRWLDSYLCDRSQRIRLRNTTSDPCPVTSGAPQGSLLGPFLFVLYCNDLKPLMSTTYISQYADDVSEVLAVQKSHYSVLEENASNEYNNICEWAARNKLCLNKLKTKAILFSKRGLELELLLPFPLVDQVTLLGVKWSSDLSWTEHFRNLKPRCSRRLYLLRVLKPVLTHDELWKLYEALIESVFLYAAPLFGELQSHTTLLIEKIFRRARRIICTPSCRCDFSTENRFHEKRLNAIKNLLTKSQNNDHPLNDIVPTINRARFSVPFSRTSRRRNCFTVYSAILVNNIPIT